MADISNKILDSKEKLLNKISQLEESLSELKRQEEIASFKTAMSEKILNSKDITYMLVDENDRLSYVSDMIINEWKLEDKDVIGRKISEILKLAKDNFSNYKAVTFNNKGLKKANYKIYIKSNGNNDFVDLGQKHYNKLINLMHNGFVHFDLNGNVIDINDVAKSILSTECVSNIKKLKFQDLKCLHTDSIVEDYNQCQKSGIPVVQKKTILQNKGENQFLEYSILPVETNENLVSGVMLVIQDNGDELQIQEELIRILTALDNTGVAIITTDEKNRLSFVNRSAVYLWGYANNGEMITENKLDDLFDKESLSKLHGHWHKMVSDRVYYFSDELTAKRIDGTSVPVEVKATLVTDINENAVGITLSVNDISEQIKSRNELLSAKEKAEESDRLKSAFLANMSHEIRTPMNAILGFSNLLKKSNLADDARSKYVRLINNNGELLVKIIDDIIDLSKIESNQLKIVAHDCDVNALLKETLFFFEKALKKLEKTSLSLVLTLPESFNVVLSVDTLRLRQVLFNLIENAIKFTAFGKVEFGYTIKKDNKIQFFVKDTGIGIPYEKQHMIFDRFLQLDDSPAREHGGTGLGLTISKNLVEMMNGKIWVDAEPNVGASFNFSLPINKSVSTVVTQENFEEDLSNIDWSDKTILITEDEENNYYLLKEFLFDTKAKVLWAKDGRESINVFKNNQIDAVLLDIKIPNMSGYDVVKEMKKINPDIPVIAQTAYALTGDKEKIIEAGCDDYLSKPIDITSMLSLLNKLIKN